MPGEVSDDVPKKNVSDVCPKPYDAPARFAGLEWEAASREAGESHKN